MTGYMRPITVGIIAQRIQTWLAPSDSYMLVNDDIANTMYVGNDPNVQPIPVPPLGSFTVAGSNNKDTWISTGGGNYTLQALLLPNGTNWTPSPAQVAASISALGLATATNQNSQIALQTTNPDQTAALIATGNAAGAPGGVPMLRYTNQLGSGSLQNLPISIPESLVNGVSVNQPGFEMWINFWFPTNSGTVPFASLRFQWADSVTGLNIKSQMYVLTAGNAQGNALSYYLNGPCYGDTLYVTLTNLDPAIAGTYGFVINQTSHVFLHDSILQPGYATGAAPFGFTNPNGTPGLGVLGTVVAAIAAAASVTRLLAVCSGKVFVEVDNLGGANACRIRMLDPSSGNIYGSGSPNQSFYSNTIAAAGSIGQEVCLPRGPVLLELHNNGASGSITPAVTITIEDY